MAGKTKKGIVMIPFLFLIKSLLLFHKIVKVGTTSH